MLISERLSQLVAHYGINLTEFSKKLGLNNSVTVSKIINQNRKPSSKTIGRIIKAYPEINYDWLINGKGDMLKTTQTNYFDPDDLTATAKQVIDYLQSMYKIGAEDRTGKTIKEMEQKFMAFLYEGKEDLNKAAEAREQRLIDYTEKGHKVLDKKIDYLNKKLENIDFTIEEIEKYNLIEEVRKEDKLTKKLKKDLKNGKNI
jgi:transcriptional regulator with XRE-family HTH domain